MFVLQYNENIYNKVHRKWTATFQNKTHNGTEV